MLVTSEAIFVYATAFSWKAFHLERVGAGEGVRAAGAVGMADPS
jgi:hypothetical protein